MPQTATIRESLNKTGRFASLGLRRSEQGMDIQIELESLANDNTHEAEETRKEITLDAADDRQRFRKYQAVEWAIRHGTKQEQLLTFHSLVAHVEADEMREDERRVGKRKARLLHAVRLTSLRAIFREDIMPLLVGDES